MEAELIQRIYSWLKKEEKAPPYTLQLHLTNKACNLDCNYCWQKAHDQLARNQLSQKKHLQLIDQASSLGVEAVDLTGGGEPLLSPSFEAVVKRVKQQNMRGRLVTNATLFNRDLVYEMVDERWDEVSISLDSPNQETQDKVRGEGRYKRMIKALKQFKEIKKELNASKPAIHLIPVLSNENYSEIPQFFQLAEKFGVYKLFFQPLMVHTNEMEKYKIKAVARRELSRYLRQGIKLAEKYDIETNLVNCDSGELGQNSDKTKDNLEKMRKNQQGILNIACYQPWYLMKVFPVEKTAGPCMTSKGYSMTIEGNSLEEIWYGDKANQLREKLKKGEIPQFCQDCCGGNVIINQELKDLLERKERT